MLKMLSKNFITIFNRKPSKAGEEYFFKIPRSSIREGIIDPEKTYELRVFDFDNNNNKKE